MSQLEELKKLDIPVFCNLEELRENIGTNKKFFIKYYTHIINCIKKSPSLREMEGIES